jgi:hypothetical protein
MLRTFAVLLVVSAIVTCGLAGVHPVLANGSGHHFGPFATTNDPDSGTCGNNWASDNFKRDFNVTDNGDGTFTVEEQFVDGQFTTVDGLSPGACETTTDHGATITAGVVGHFHGILVGTVTDGTLNPDGCTPSTCNTTSGFVAAVFGPGATYSCISGPGSCSFSFEYEAPASGLLFKHWHNASPDLGGNSGDIAGG